MKIPTVGEKITFSSPPSGAPNYTAHKEVEITNVRIMDENKPDGHLDDITFKVGGETWNASLAEYQRAKS